MTSTIKETAFFNKLRYTFGNEDWITEQKALKLKPNDEVVCITASGDRPLHLLLQPLKKLTAVDANPTQNYLLELKIAAIKDLNYKNYAALLGLNHYEDRLLLLDKILPHLSESAQFYWQNNAKEIRKGILYRGETEKWIQRGAFFLKLFRKKEINALFACTTLDEQKRFLDSIWNHKLWKRSITLFLNPTFVRLFFKDPGLYDNYETHIKPGSYIYDRMMDYLKTHLAKDNFFMQLIFLGHVGLEAVPPYLQEKSYATLQKNVSKIEIETNNVITFLENSPSGSFDKFSLSDVASYLNYEDFVRLLKAVHHAAKPGARFCMRQFISRYRLPEQMAPLFTIDSDLAGELEKEDKAFVYHFTVGTVNKKN